MKDYGKEVIIDMHECDPDMFNRVNIEAFFIDVCNRIDMVRQDLYFWDDLDTPKDEKQTEPHLVGTSAVQFILTSNITIHTLDLLGKVYINVFSCKDFEASVVVDCAKRWFMGIVVSMREVRRI